jgi:CIC family chloride channel protein
MLLTSIVTGVIVGVVVAAVEYVTVDLLLEELETFDLWLLALMPMLGLALAALSLRWIAGGASSKTADEYISAFHDRNPVLPIRQLPGKLIAGITTIGLGGSLGLEGPSIYAGATIGSTLQARLGRWFTRDESRALLVAGAAAGVAAIFKTPATGVMFALESPYRGDVARHALLPALMASASGFLVSRALIGDEAVAFLGTSPTLESFDLLGAALIGVVAGLGARAFAWGVRWAKHTSERLGPVVRVVGAGVVLGALVIVSTEVFDGEALTMGPGNRALAWADESEALGLLALLFLLRALATLTTVMGGGTGGLFIPLVVQGSLIGRMLAVWRQPSEDVSNLFPILGLAAFLGAGYRTPIAAVMFVAETTGGARYVVPALIAAATSQLVMGPRSVATSQRAARLGHLERRFELPITAALTTEIMTVPTDATVTEFVWAHIVGRRATLVPVVDGGQYVGVAGLQEIAPVERDAWDETLVGEIVRREVPAALPSWTMRDAIVAMERHDLDFLPVTDREGHFVGIIDAAEVLRLDQILDETGG